jgi:prepilin-type N-terminal cleavage/methylation domain-containing protein
MSNKLKELRTKEGFTIIEVIIVLVIGAVIMLAVFLVVPQLQRTQRNARQQDNARRILTSTQQYLSNNQNNFPGSGQNILDITGTLTNPSGNVALTNNDITIGTTPAVGAAGTAVTPTVGKAVIINNAKCNGTNNTTGQTNAIAVIIGIEPSGYYCVDVQ